MTENPAPRAPGKSLIKWGAVLACLSLFFVFAQFTSAADPAPLPWLMALVGFGLVVVGFLQKIAAK